ncbi:cobalamin-dependent protein [Herbaspirillum sp. ST 5-3]|uniref:cobalamin B12-binding domain-containing protein n=1 Tax=Oxalobacteraceae TaxID=75682 RepID=UPI0010A46451|nr:cobalamin-dependent protein [Herbaspirillum sp. ST 5-3]
MIDRDALFNAICKGDRKTVIAIVQGAVDADGDVVSLLNEVMIPAMREVGERFSRNDIFVPEMLVAARAMQGGIDIIEPILANAGYEPIAKVCIGSVKGDLHDIGKNLVVMMLKGAGFEVEDLGVDVEVEQFDDAVQRGARVVCLSALLTTTKDEMRTVIEHFRAREDVKVVVGGAVITQDYADEIGAAGFGRDATDAVRAVKDCIGIAA